MDFKKVAIVTDYILALGGSDRLLQSLIKIFPNSDIYTAQFNPKNYLGIKNKIYTSFLQNFIFRKIFYRSVSVLAPIAFESFDFRSYDLVISISAGPAKGIITPIDCTNIAIICTPPRNQWDGDLNVRGSIFKNIYRFGSKLLSTYLRIWDSVAIKRADYVISISQFIQKKVFKTYGLTSQVIYPPVLDTYLDSSNEKGIDIKEKYEIPDNYLLVVSRLYDYKRIDMAIQACNATNQNLVIVGSGPDEKYLKKLAKGTNTLFLKNISELELKLIYSKASALLFCGIEDFGIVPVEAMSQGCPVLAYNEGGVMETVIDSQTGYFFDNIRGLEELINNEVWKNLRKDIIRARAEKYSESEFIKEFKKYLNKIYEKTE